MATSEQRIEIPLSKKRIFLMLLGALIFVAIGLWFIIYPPTISKSYSGNLTILAIVGYAAIVFFGLCAFFLSRKLFDKKHGLVIDQTGLTDNSSAGSVVHILWSDIESISIMEIHRQKLIMIHVTNPQDYIDKQTSSFKRKMMQMNYKMYGTPLSIASNGLKISFGELLSTLKDKLEKVQNISSSTYRL
jgi:hypothetical protein